MNFVNFAGNEKVKQQLTILQQSNRLPHAIVIEGEEGLGKRTLAKEIALNLFCKGDGEKPCLHCAQCVKVLKGIHPDVFEYSAAGGARSFHVDVVRDVKQDVYMQPNEAEYKIYILGNCQCMSENAQNAILKILEEPPSYAVFILTVNTKSALLETVLSRSVVLSLEGVDSKTGAEYICSENENISYDDAYSAVSIWSGNIGRAAESLSDGKMSKINAVADDICRALLSNNEYELIKACSVFEKNRDLLLSVLSLLKSVFRDALMSRCNISCVTGKDEIIKSISGRLNAEKIVKLVAVCDSLSDAVYKNANNNILITKMCYDFRRAQNR